MNFSKIGFRTFHFAQSTNLSTSKVIFTVAGYHLSTFFLSEFYITVECPVYSGCKTATLSTNDWIFIDCIYFVLSLCLLLPILVKSYITFFDIIHDFFS